MPVPSRLRSMPESELIARATAPPRRLLSGILIAVFILAGVVGFPWVELRDKSWSWAWLWIVPMLSCIGWVFAALLLVAIQKLFGRERYAWELLRRSGWREFDDRVEEATREIAAPDGPEWSVLFSGRGLPHGGLAQARLDGPSAKRETGRLEFASLTFWNFDRFEGSDPREELDIGAEPVQAERLAPFVRAMADIDERPLDGAVATHVMDGYPFDLTILRRSSAKPVSVHGNLAGGCKDVRALTLAQGILDLSHEFGTRKTLVGSCDARGNIVIGGR